MNEIKVRKIGNSLGVILRKDLGLHNGDILTYTKEKNLFIIDTSKVAIEHDRHLIEESFADFEVGLSVSEEEMKASSGKYGWK